MINDLVKFSMSLYIFRHLCGIAGLREYRYNDTEEIRREWNFLKDNGFIEPKKLGGVVDFNASLAGRNLVDIVEPTPIGWFYIKSRQEEAEELLKEDEANVKKYVWEEIRREEKYLYAIAERVAIGNACFHPETRGSADYQHREAVFLNQAMPITVPIGGVFPSFLFFSYPGDTTLSG